MGLCEVFLMDATTKIQAFYNACTDAKYAKFILAESKISEILRAIVNSPELVSVVSDSLAGFNFSSEFNKIQVKNEMRRINIMLPKDPNKLVAIVFSLLGEIDAHRVDFHDFIFSYFDAGGSTLLQCYDKFVETIIFPFRDTLCELVGYEVEDEEEETEDDEYANDVDVDEDWDAQQDEEDSILPNNWEEDEGEEDMLDYDNEENDYSYDAQEEQNNNDRVSEFFDDITVIINQIQDTINNDSRIKQDRKDELNITLDAILLAIDYRSLKIFNALMISLNEMLKFVRSTKFYNNELQNRIAEFYDEML